MIQQPIGEFVEQLGARTPTPGGGAASAVAGAMGAALALMVVRFCQGKEANAAREGDLAKAEASLLDHSQRLGPMGERDIAVFGRVAEAYRLPKATPDEQALRRKAIQGSLRGAMEVPEETLCMVRDAVAAVAEVKDCVGKAIVSDLAAALELLTASAEGSMLNVRVNAAYLDDKVLASATLERSRSVLAEVRSHRDAIRALVEQLIG